MIYEIPNSPLLVESIAEIDEMTKVLGKIQTKFMEKTDAQEILSSIINWLKDVNNVLKPYLKRQQKTYQEKLFITKNNYIRIGDRISRALYVFVQKFSLKLGEKDTLSKKEKDVVQALVWLNENRQKIERFKSIRFGTKNDMRDYYINIIKSIRKEISIIKALLN